MKKLTFGLKVSRRDSSVLISAHFFVSLSEVTGDFVRNCVMKAKNRKSPHRSHCCCSKRLFFCQCFELSNKITQKFHV